MKLPNVGEIVKTRCWVKYSQLLGSFTSSSNHTINYPTVAYYLLIIGQFIETPAKSHHDFAHDGSHGTRSGKMADDEVATLLSSWGFGEEIRSIFEGKAINL